ncbi:MAG: hypothetical protein Unbinned92contig1003_11 [Prokaryotic dsDNA virus sp.]|nr:MAG: hypothetical protein Unbinned92contig1003_11 [Prokaryotic dsDNA virus sp.]|tara:strand:+ start:9314 stop:11404 length:2091 start_codon:yes stop_codon:yes gene_type:complete
MIRLQVKEQNSSKLIDLDVYGTENINLTLQVDDVRSFATKNASYSKEFQLPATKTNNDFFKQYYNLDNFTTTYSPYKVAKVFLYVNDVLLIEGFLMLTKALEKTTERSYSVIIFNDVANILEVLADATLAHLDYTDIEHHMTPQNVFDSWTNGVTLSDGATVTDNVFYPLINDGYIGTNLELIDLGAWTYRFNEHHVMNLKLKYIIDKIFDFAGFKLSSNFFNTSYFESIYFDTGIQQGADDVEPTSLITCDGIDNSLPVGIPYYGQLAINWTNESGDLNSQFNHNTSIFTAAYTSPVNFSITIDITGAAQVIGGQIILPNGSIYLGGLHTHSDGTVQDVDLGSAYNYVVATNTITMSGTRTLNAGDTLLLYLYSDTVVFDIPAGANASLKITQFPQFPTTSMIVQDIGDIKLADILKDVLNMFNLTVESIGSDRLRIEPYSDFISNTIHDWTDKVDYNEHSVEPIEIPKRIQYKFADDDENYKKQLYDNFVNVKFGNHIIEFDVDSDEIITIQNSVFASPITEILSINGMQIQSIKTQSGEDEYVAYKNKPRLVFKRSGDLLTFGGIPEEGIFNGFYGVLVENTLNAHAFDKKFSSCTNDDQSLLYGLINTTFIDGDVEQPLNTLFNRFWFPYIRERYNVDNGLIVKFKINLRATDLNEFSFGDKVRVEQQLYRVNKIEFNTEKQLLSKIELIRI